MKSINAIKSFVAVFKGDDHPHIKIEKDAEKLDKEIKIEKTEILDDTQSKTMTSSSKHYPLNIPHPPAILSSQSNFITSSEAQIPFMTSVSLGNDISPVPLSSNIPLFPNNSSDPTALSIPTSPLLLSATSNLNLPLTSTLSSIPLNSLTSKASLSSTPVSALNLSLKPHKNEDFTTGSNLSEDSYSPNKIYPNLLNNNDDDNVVIDLSLPSKKRRNSSNENNSRINSLYCNKQQIVSPLPSSTVFLGTS